MVYSGLPEHHKTVACPSIISRLTLVINISFLYVLVMTLFR